MRKLIATGRGTNLKTGKEIRFRIPESISREGLERIRKNIQITRFELEELYVRLLHFDDFDAILEARKNPDITVGKLETIKKVHEETIQRLKQRSGHDGVTLIPPPG